MRRGFVVGGDPLEIDDIRSTGRRPGIRSSRQVPFRAGCILINRIVFLASVESWIMLNLLGTELKVLSG